MPRDFRKSFLKKAIRKDIVDSVFEPAKVGGGFQYILTLVRAEGWTTYSEDNIKRLERKIKEFLQAPKGDKRQIQRMFDSLNKEYAVYGLMANLLNNSKGQPYKLHPLSTQQAPSGFGIISPTDGKHLSELSKLIKDVSDNPRVREFAGDLDSFVSLIQKSSPTRNDYLKAVNSICKFLYEFIQCYKYTLSNFKHDPLFYRMPNDLLVVELLTNQNGLIGFKIHHPDGATSFFKRMARKTEQANYMIEARGIAFTGGFQNNYESLYKINGESAYIKGIPGRYNLLGEWKPIVYPAPSTTLIEQITKNLADDADDHRIRGCIFYIVATCHHCIEFILKTKFELPFEINTIEGEFGTLYLQKFTPKSKEGATQNIQAYDCTLQLKAIDADSIKNALDAIDEIVNRITFRIDSSASWFLKYPSVLPAEGVLQLSNKDFPLLREYLLNFSEEDSIKFDTAISWYLNGKNSRNVFTQYLSYYIALESLAISFALGDLSVCRRYRVKKKSRSQRKAEKINCIQKMHARLYEHNPEQFVNESHSECIMSLRKKTRFALERVFGKNHTLVKEFFQKKEGYSLYGLRNELAHGNFSHVDKEHAKIIEKRLPEMKNISFELILRLSSTSTVKRKLRKFNRYSIAMNMNDPRFCHVASTFDVLPRSDWTIIPDWLE